MTFISLFLVAFVAATLWPMASEALLTAYLIRESSQWPWLLVCATAGNTLGSIVMFELAAGANAWINKRVHSIAARLARWQKRLSQFGPVVLVFAWLPVVGDVLPIAAGVLKLPRLPVYIWLTIGKFARYVFICWIVLLNAA